MKTLKDIGQIDAPTTVQTFFALGNHLYFLFILYSQLLLWMEVSTECFLMEPVKSCSPDVSDGKASAYNAGDSGSTPGLGRSPGEGSGNPLQYSCLENPVDGGA